MSKEKKLALSKAEGLIPELRFPEFKNEGEWEVKFFEELFEIGNGRDYKHLDKGDIPVYGSGGYMLSVNDFLYDGESVCIGRKGTIDKPMFLNGKFWTVDTLFYTHSFKNCFPKYIHYLFQNIDWLKHNEAGGVPSLSKTNIYKIETAVPKLPEQQKIATCLSSLDEVIAAHSQKLELLKNHKKALMQNLFPSAGEKVPKYRFKEFEGDGEWEKKELGDLVTIKGRIGYRGYTKEDIVSKGEGAISMSPSNISEQGALSFEKSTYITWDKYYESPEIMLENGFTVLVKTGSTFGKVAFISNLVEKATINPQLVVLKPNGVDKYFLYLIVSNTAVQKQITATVVGGAIPTLSQDSISKFEVLVPREEEQQKIASCLSAVDELITAQAEKIEQLQQHKKGLMQGLFPKIES